MHEQSMEDNKEVFFKKVNEYPIFRWVILSFENYWSREMDANIIIGEKAFVGATSRHVSNTTGIRVRRIVGGLFISEGKDLEIELS